MVLDVRVNEYYKNSEVNNLIVNSLPCDVKARSLHLESSSIDDNHPLVIAGKKLAEAPMDPHLSDQAALSCPSLKLGPGDSKRSHTADEFIYIHEIEEGVKLYIDLLKQIL